MAGDKTRKEKFRSQTVWMLSKELRDKVRSGCTISNVTQCVEELVYNSIDAGATRIYVGVNLNTFKVEVEDNGPGISVADLEFVGKRYVTSKCASESDLKTPRFYGQRGEALASIISVSRAVKLFTRPTKGIGYRRWFHNGRDGQIEEVLESRKPPGLTVTIDGLLENQPVRQKRLDKSIQLEDVKRLLESLALANPTISIEFSNEATMTPMLRYEPCYSYEEAFDQLFSSKKRDAFDFVTVNHLQKGIVFGASIGQKLFRHKCYQYVFVNRRWVETRGKIHKVMNDIILKLLSSKDSEGEKPKSDKMFPVFILNITCSLEKYCSQRDEKYGVQFWDSESCVQGLGGLLLKFQQILNPSSSVVELDTICQSQRLVSIAPASKFKGITQAKTKNSPEQFLGRYNNISTRTVKGALHSRVICRDDGGSVISSDSSLDEPNLKRSNYRDVDEMCSVTYADLEDSPTMIKPKLQTPTRKSMPKQTLKNPTAKNTVYNVRRTEKKVDLKKSLNNPAGKPRKNIVAPRPILKGIFQQFPQWKQSSSEEQAISSDASYSPAAKKRKYDSFAYKPKEKLPRRNREFKEATSQELEENTEYIEDDKTGFNWKLARFIAQIKKPKVAQHQIFESEDDDEEIEDADAFSVAVNISPSSKSPLNKIYSLSEDNNNQRQLNTTINGQRRKLKTVTFVTPGSRIFSVFGNSHLQTKKKEEDDNWFDDIMIQSAKKFVISKQGDLERLNYFIKKLLIDDFMEHTPEPNFRPCTINQNTIPFDTFDSNKKEKVVDNHTLKLPLQLPAPFNDQKIEISNESYIPPSFDILDFNDNQLRPLSSDDSFLNFLPTQQQQQPRPISWLSRYFPKGYDKLWDRTENNKKPQINGNIAADTNHLSEKVKEYIIKSAMEPTEPIPDVLKKWTEDALSEAVAASKPNNSIGSEELKRRNKIISGSMKFSKDDLSKVKVICQWDKKFIVAKIPLDGFDQSEDGVMVQKEILVLFDQHAVHERIRLENLIDSIHQVDSITGTKSIASRSIAPPINLNFTETEVRILTTYKDAFKARALDVECVNLTTVKISSAPCCFFDKILTEPLSNRINTLKEIITNYVQEEVGKVFELKSCLMTSIPKMVFNILCSQACHGAIKFGDELQINTCEQMISDLRECKVPFQCAHGRPAVIPLIDLADLYRFSSTSIEDEKIQTQDAQNDDLENWTQSKSAYFYTSSEYFSEENF